MNKNMIILIGLIITWFCVVRMNQSNEKNTQISTTNTATDTENSADTQSLSVAQNSHYVEISKKNAINTKSPYENYDLRVYGNTYTS